jgi:hypothetical protein
VPDHIQVEMRPSSTARFKATRHQRSLGALTAPAFRIGSLRKPVRCSGVFTARAAFRKQSMPALTEDTVPIRRAIAYVIELYRELTAENGAPSLGTQNQVVEFILADPELREAVAQWGQAADPDEAATQPLRRLPCDATYQRARAYLRRVMDEPVFTRPGQEPGDRR